MSQFGNLQAEIIDRDGAARAALHHVLKMITVIPSAKVAPKDSA